MRPIEPYGCRRDVMVGWLTILALAVAAAILAMSLGILGAAVVCGAEVTKGQSAVALWRVTAYCPCRRCCGRDARGVTASGTRADHPLIAAPREVPFGTLLAIPGYAGGRPVRVEDRGGAIRGRRLDLLFATHEEALSWGVKELPIADCDLNLEP